MRFRRPALLKPAQPRGEKGRLMPATVTQLRPRETPAAPDPDTPVVAAWLLRRGWTALDAFHAGLSAELAAAMFVLEASVP